MCLSSPANLETHLWALLPQVSLIGEAPPTTASKERGDKQAVTINLRLASGNIVVLNILALQGMDQCPDQVDSAHQQHLLLNPRDESLSSECPLLEATCANTSAQPPRLNPSLAQRLPILRLTDWAPKAVGPPAMCRLRSDQPVGQCGQAAAAAA